MSSPPGSSPGGGGTLPRAPGDTPLGGGLEVTRGRGAPPDRLDGVPTTGKLSFRSPAFVVLALAVVILVVGFTASAIVTSAPTTLTIRSLRLKDGTVVPVQPGASALKPIETLGQPPPDILASLAVPTGTRTVSSTNSAGGASQYNETIDMESPLDGAELHAFFTAEFATLGWMTDHNGADPGQPQNIEVLAEKGSTDGYYWECGVVISPESATGATPFALTIFEVPDSS